MSDKEKRTKKKPLTVDKGTTWDGVTHSHAVCAKKSDSHHSSLSRSRKCYTRDGLHKAECQKIVGLYRSGNVVERLDVPVDRRRRCGDGGGGSLRRGRRAGVRDCGRRRSRRSFRAGHGVGGGNRRRRRIRRRVR